MARVSFADPVGGARPLARLVQLRRLRPGQSEQTFLYWAVSTLVFLLTVTLGFMLFRTVLKLYIERRSNREGSRIKTRLLAGALALSFMPVFFLVLWSVSVLNYNLAKWFSAPAQEVRDDLGKIVEILGREANEKAASQAVWLAGCPNGGAGLGRQRVARRLCQQRNIAAAELVAWTIPPSACAERQADGAGECGRRSKRGHHSRLRAGGPRPAATSPSSSSASSNPSASTIS